MVYKSRWHLKTTVSRRRWSQTRPIHKLKWQIFMTTTTMRNTMTHRTGPTTKKMTTTAVTASHDRAKTPFCRHRHRHTHMRPVVATLLLLTFWFSPIFLSFVYFFDFETDANFDLQNGRRWSWLSFFKFRSCDATDEEIFTENNSYKHCDYIYSILTN